MFGMRSITRLACVAAVLGASGLTAAPALAASKVRNLTLMVQQDWSDCSNANVVAAPSRVAGEGLVTRRDDGQTTVNVRLTRVAPNTTYHLFLKCFFLLGDISTDANGRGNNTFSFPTATTGPIYAFDMYPSGAPLGNKYQSVQINFQ